MNLSKLSDAEFEVMQIIWKLEQPVQSKEIIENIENSKEWKPQTILTLLTRLINKGFVDCKKINNRNEYSYLITESDYLSFETSTFMKRFHKNSVKNFVATLYNDKISDDVIDELKEIINEKVK